VAVAVAYGVTLFRLVAVAVLLEALFFYLLRLFQGHNQ
jgi:hypothetical protein